MHEYKDEFYGTEMSVVVLGYIRPELDYISRGEWVGTQIKCTRADGCMQRRSSRISRLTNG